MAPPLNYTTKINPERTLAEIQTILAKHGARQITIDYADGGTIDAVSFVAPIGGTPATFRLPINWRGVQTLLQQERLAASFCTEAHARRVAWRIVKDWLEAQFALVAAGQATLQQVMLPYVIAPDGRTVYEHFAAHGTRLLGDTA